MAAFEDYRSAIAYIFQQLPMYQRTGMLPAKLDLSRTQAMLAALDQPERGLSIVHVGGTNGKGTVSHILASFANAAGLKVGLYTSPHYVDYRERIRVNGQCIDEAYVHAFVEAHHVQIQRLGLSFFELTCCMGLAYFRDREVDLVVLEVGLGGRLDSTNVVTPLLSVITNVDLDHTDVLGSTRAQIAAEKAGIVKAGVPLLVGRRQAETAAVFERFTDELRSELHYAQELVHVERVNGSFLTRGRDMWSSFRLPHRGMAVRGPFAEENLRTAFAAWQLLSEWASHLNLCRLPYEALYRMSALSGYGGRFQSFDTQPRILADAGHNDAAWSRVMPALGTLAAGGSLYVVAGFVKGKDPRDFVRYLRESATLIVCDVDVPRNRPRAETIVDLNDLCRARGHRLLDGGTLSEGLQLALRLTAPEDLVFVGGSSYVVGELLPQIQELTFRSPA